MYTKVALFPSLTVSRSDQKPSVMASTLGLELSTFLLDLALFESNVLPLLNAEPSDLHREYGVSTHFRHPEQIHHGTSGSITIGCFAYCRDELAAAVHTGSDRGEQLKSFVHHRQYFLTARRWIGAAFDAVVALLSKEALTCHRLRMAGEKQPGVGSERSTHVLGTVTWHRT